MHSSENWKETKIVKMEKLLKLQEENIKNLEEIYVGLKIATEEELTKNILERKLKVVMVLWDKIYDTNTTIGESADSGFQIEYFTSKEYDEAFSIFDASVMLIYSYLDLLRTQSSIQSIQISEVVKVTEHRNENFKSTVQQDYQNSTILDGNQHQQSQANETNFSQNSPLETINEIISGRSEVEPEAENINFTEKLLLIQRSKKPLRRVQIIQPNKMQENFELRSKSSEAHHGEPTDLPLSKFIRILSTWWPTKRNLILEICIGRIRKKTQPTSKPFNSSN